MPATIILAISFEAIVCANCGMHFCLDSATYNRLRKDHLSFYCPMGHSQHFAAESAEEKLRRERDRLVQNAARLEDEIAIEKRRTAAAKAEITKIRNRVNAGVCPCCNRTFQNLAKHMKGKHPDVVPLKANSR